MATKLRLIALPALALLAACSSGRSFSDVVGNLRITGDVAESTFSQRAGLDVQLYDASTGYPVDARDIEVRAGRTKPVRAIRKQLGVYAANIPNRERIDLFITTQDSRSVIIALQQK
ncbi:MAG TPA: hypothetical protein VKT72_09705 [Candidatus Baltobacteraceae bacterium]|nr:hypothetical protein [Candidatus Baltobacteraceae bacterium]